MNAKTIFTKVSKIIRNEHNVSTMKQLNAEQNISLSRRGDDLFFTFVDGSDLQDFTMLLLYNGFVITDVETSEDSNESRVVIEKDEATASLQLITIQQDEDLADEEVTLHLDIPYVSDEVIETVEDVIEATEARYRFTVLNYNKRADGFLLLSAFNEDELLVLAKAEMAAASKTGGYQLILEDTSKEKKRERFTKVYCSKVQAEKIIATF